MGWLVGLHFCLRGRTDIRDTDKGDEVEPLWKELAKKTAGTMKQTNVGTEDAPIMSLSVSFGSKHKAEDGAKCIMDDLWTDEAMLDAKAGPKPTTYVLLDF